MNLEKLVIPIQADTKQAQTGIQKLSGGFKDFTGISLTAVGAIGAVGGALYATAQYLYECNQEAIAYNNAMLDMARITGMTTDETQYLSRAADDVRITQESLQKAMETANKKGYSTSIESIQKMAEEYDNLGSEVEKAQFLTERFGKAGLEMGKLFELGAKGVKEALDNVRNLPILTVFQVEELEKERQAIDNLNDGVEALKQQLGAAVAKPLTDFYSITGKITEKLAIIIGNVNLINDLVYRGHLPELTGEWLKTLAWTGLTIDEVRQKLIEAGVPLSVLNSTTIELNKNLDQTPEKVEAIVSPLDHVKKSASEVAWDILTIKNYWNSIRDKSVTITIITKYLTQGSSVAGFDNKGAPVVTTKTATGNSIKTNTPIRGFADGGSFTIPSGFPNDSFYLGAGNWGQSGETVTVTPKDKVNEPVKAYIDPKELARAMAEAMMLAGLAA